MASSYLALPRLYDRVRDLASEERGMERWSECSRRRWSEIRSRRAARPGLEERWIEETHPRDAKRVTRPKSNPTLDDRDPNA